MRPETAEQERLRRFAAVERLRPLGFRPLGRWLFLKDATGVTYDLSAADLTQIDRIEREGLFVVPDGEVHRRILALADEWKGAHSA